MEGWEGDLSGSVDQRLASGIPQLDIAPQSPRRSADPLQQPPPSVPPDLLQRGREVMRQFQEEQTIQRNLERSMPLFNRALQFLQEFQERPLEEFEPELNPRVPPFMARLVEVPPIPPPPTEPPEDPEPDLNIPEPVQLAEVSPDASPNEGSEGDL